MYTPALADIMAKDLQTALDGCLLFSQQLFSNIPSSPAYGVFISQLIRYPALAPRMNVFFILRVRRLSGNLLKQGYLVERLNLSFGKFYGRLGDLFAIWSFPLTNIKWHSDPWPTVTSKPIRLSTHFKTFIPTLTFIE